MNTKSGLICLVIIAVCGLSARFGREKRRAGGRVTPRDVVWVMALAWAAGWAAIGLPVLFEWGRHVAWSETIPAALALLALSVSPLVLVLAAIGVARLNLGAKPYPKKRMGPHPLD
jgi:hypothetical protein